MTDSGSVSPSSAPGFQPGSGSGHGNLMDAVYRQQRFIYDLTRKYYLFGRDRLIRDLNIPQGGRVLEVGCGTGRNLSLTARKYPASLVYGLDISSVMLDTARKAMARSGVGERARLALADATDFDAQSLFGRRTFDRVYLSYALSMVPDWRAALLQSYEATAPGGELHIVDFGDLAGLPGWFRAGLRKWLTLFHVDPRLGLPALARKLAEENGGELRFTPIMRGYAWSLVLTKP